jgi:hypothetical protein
MIRWLFRLVVLAGLVALGIWGWRVLFPGPEQAIRRQLIAVARETSISPGQGILPKAASLTTLRAFFTDDVEVKVEIPGQRVQTFTSRDQLMEVAAGVKATWQNLKVEFVDIDVALASTRQSAIVHATVRLDTPGQRMPEVQPLKVGLKKIDGEWLINRVETEKALR